MAMQVESSALVLAQASYSVYVLILLLGLSLLAGARLMIGHCNRAAVIEVYLFLALLPLLVAFISLFDRWQSLESASGMLKALLVILFGFLSTLPAYAFIARDLLNRSEPVVGMQPVTLMLCALADGFRHSAARQSLSGAISRARKPKVSDTGGVNDSFERVDV